MLVQADWRPQRHRLRRVVCVDKNVKGKETRKLHFCKYKDHDARHGTLLCDINACLFIS